MATTETSLPKTTLELLCKESGVPYTQELRDYEANLERLRQLGELANLAKFVDSQPLPPINYLDSTSTATTPEIEQTVITSHSIACEHHPQRNEDNSFVINIAGRAHAGGVFDGLGGVPGSERASKLAAEIAMELFGSLDTDILSPAEAKLFSEQLLDAVETKIHESGSTIATTAAIASIHTNPETGMRYANIAWAGDSRVYVIRSGAILYRTLDDGNTDYDSTLDEMYPDIDPEYRVQAFLESATHTEYPFDNLRHVFRTRNYIKNCLGGRNNDLTIHTHQLDAQPGDIILATSDGVHDNLTNKEILALINDGGTVENLTRAALKRSRDDDHLRAKPDDITAVMITV